MNISATLIGQMLTFALFVWFTMKFVWPPLSRALQERQETIADGLASAERGQQALVLAQQKAAQTIREAKGQSSEILDKANVRAGQIIEEAKVQAREEARRIAEQAQAELTQEVSRARESLRQELVSLSMAGAEKILGRAVDKTVNDDFLKQLTEGM